MSQIMEKVKKKTMKYHMDVQTSNIRFNNGQYTTDTLSFPDSERTEVLRFR
jgi:hypothetical protein